MSSKSRLGLHRVGWVLLLTMGVFGTTPAFAKLPPRIYNPWMAERIEALKQAELERGLPTGMNFLPEAVFKFLGSVLNPLDGPELPTAQPLEKTFDQKLNPADPSDTRTFQQRYYLFSDHASGPSAPVVYYICGEAECSTREFMGRFAEEVARTLHAHLIALEHRYYGKSQPFPALTPENLQYLSGENAIADLAAFQKFAMSELGLNGKWLSIGGSYPGSLSAYYRLKHPELVVGALASSAPVQARNDFEEYDSHVTEVLGASCAEPLRQVVSAAETALNAGHETYQLFKARFNAADIQNDTDFLYVLADTTADAVQYGYPEKLCAVMTTATDPVEAYSKYVREFLAGRHQTAVEFSPENSLKLGAQASDGMRQWYYQSCKEFGYWQDSHHDAQKSVRSARINAAYDRDYCRRAFGISELADESRINANYYEPLLRPETASHILFTNGSNDPWSELSITAARGNNANPDTAVYLVEGKAHCSDLRPSKDTDSESSKQAHQLFFALAADWLK